MRPDPAITIPSRSAPEGAQELPLDIGDDLAVLGERLRGRRGLGIAYGPANTGKTVAAASLARACQAAWLSYSRAYTQAELVDLLVEALAGGGPAPRSRRSKRELRAASTRPRLLVIDDAHLLTRNAQELLRATLTASECRTRVILVGRETLLREVTDLGLLSSHVVVPPTIASAIPDPRAVDLIPALHPLFRGLDAATVRSINRSCAGLVGRWCDVLAEAQTVLRLTNRDELTDDVIQHALQSIASLTHAGW